MSASTSLVPPGHKIGTPWDYRSGRNSAPLPFSLASVLETGHLDVGDGHTLYWETAGSPDGIPVVFLHGGPGAGCHPTGRRFFDPKRYFIVMFDQRGCGRSKPWAETRANTTQHLVADVERLRVHLGISQWVVFGGSWGATLALAYSQAHPEQVLGIILRGVFMGRRSEIEWFISGMGNFRPDALGPLLDCLPHEERGDLLTNLHRRLMDPDPAVHGPVARAWCRYENACSCVGAPLVPAQVTGEAVPLREPELSMARLEAHYMVNDCFLQPDQLLRDIPKVSHLPCMIVQGAFDLVCPPRSAWEVHERWMSSEMALISDAGHSASEPGVQAALISATTAMADRLSR